MVRGTEDEGRRDMEGIDECDRAPSEEVVLALKWCGLEDVNNMDR